MIIAICCFFLAIFAYLCHTLSKNKPTSTKLQTYVNITECQALLKDAKLESRSIPNERLIRTFRVNNAFTTTNKTYQEEFRRQSTRLLATADQKWEGLIDTARQLVHHGLMQTIGKKQGGILLVPFVQVLVLKMSIHFFFNRPLRDLDDAVIRTIVNLADGHLNQSMASKVW